MVFVLDIEENSADIQPADSTESAELSDIASDDESLESSEDKLVHLKSCFW
jgi:hypothetical protein